MYKETVGTFSFFEGENAAEMVNNYDWISNLNVIDYLRDYGKCFNVNYMLAKDGFIKT